MIIVVYHRELHEMSKGESTLLHKPIALQATSDPLFVSYNNTYQTYTTIPILSEDGPRNENNRAMAKKGTPLRFRAKKGDSPHF